MVHNSIPTVAIEWGIAALRARITDLQTEVSALHFIDEHESLPREASVAYRKMAEEVRTLDLALERLENAVKQNEPPQPDDPRSLATPSVARGAGRDPVRLR